MRLAAATRDRAITPAELAGATCTVNNVGAVGISQGSPILPPGTSAIVGLGRGQPRLRLSGGSTSEYREFGIGVTCDHRLIDGGGAGRFLTRLGELLSNPIRLVVS